MAKNPQTDPAGKPATEQEKRDPHGVGPAQPAAGEEPTAQPDSGRHQTETASQPQKPPRK